MRNKNELFKNCTWLVMIAAIVLWFFYPDTVTLMVAFMSTTVLFTQGGCDILPFASTSSPRAMCISASLSPSWSHWVSKAICAQGNSNSTEASSHSISVPVPLSLSLPLLFSQGLVLVLIKAVSFCLLPAFSTACCELRGNSNAEWREKMWWLIPEDRKQALCYFAIHSVRETSLTRPDAWKRVIIWHSMVPGSLAILLHYAQLAASTAAPSSLLWRLVWMGPGRRGQSALRLGVNQGCSQ